MSIWRVKNSSYTDYIRADSIDEAGMIFFHKHGNKGVEYQRVEHRVYAVFFTGGGEPAYFKGTKKDAIAGGRLYIKQWQLDEKIDYVQEI